MTATSTTFTQKHYEHAADQIHDWRKRGLPTREATQFLVAMFSDDNPKFKPHVFAGQCEHGVPREKCR